MNTEVTLKYLDALPLVQALWWYIENIVPAESEGATEIFFHLRERYRREVQK